MHRAYLFICCAAVALAQRPEFEVASVKSSPAPEDPRTQAMLKAKDMSLNMGPRGFLPLKGATVSIQGRTLVGLVATAYKLRPSEVVAPAWASELRYDVEAKVPEPVKGADTNAMLQALLKQ